MPNNNKFTKVITTIVLPLVGAVMIAVVANACKPEPDNPPPVKNCTCIEKEHDALCGCDADAGRCDCTVKMNEMLNNGETRIWKEAGVSVEDYNVKVAEFNLGQGLNNNHKNAFANNVKEVRIKPAGTGISHDGTVLSVACDAQWTGSADSILAYLMMNNLISQVQQSAREAIRLSKARWRMVAGNAMVAATKNHSVPLHLTTPYRAHPSSNNA